MRTNKVILGTVLAAILLMCGGSFSGSTASAQGWRARAFVQPRVFVGPRVRVFTYPRVFVGPRFYPYSYYPYGYAYSRYDLGPNADRVGYRDGYDRGVEDARKGRAYDPNNSSHFRDSISAAYRDGFSRGYDYGYRRYAG